MALFKTTSLLIVLLALLQLVSAEADAKINTNVDLYSDKYNCGRIGHVCHQNDGEAYCTEGKCKIECNAGFVNKNGICWPTKAYRLGKVRKPLTLCPSEETACPIAGSKSLENFKGALHKITDMMKAKGGYECLDTSTSLEHCGGCTSTGHGQDCTKIKHTSGIGCNAGRCVVLSCEKGFTLSHDGKQCSRSSGKGSSKKKGSGGLRYLEES